MDTIRFRNSVREEAALFSHHTDDPAHGAVGCMDPPSCCIAIPKHDLDTGPTMSTAGRTSVLDIHLAAVVIIIQRINACFDIIIQLTGGKAFVWT